MAIYSSENQYSDPNNWQVSKKTASCYNESLTSGSSNRSKRKTKSMMSPYLNGEKVTLHSRVTEKKLVHRKTTDFVSSFPLAADIYKANSDEFKLTKRKTKKAKKCVHAFSNDRSLLPQACTVSDMNDSEYNETKDSRKPKPKVKKRRINKKFPEKKIAIFDRDARYCSQLNINLDSSSTDMFKHLTGDSGKVGKKPKNAYGRNQLVDNDVWAVLRNINKMHFVPSPPMSVDSVESIKKQVHARRRPSDRTDTSYVETCRTEEFAYISYDSTSLNSHSRSSSFDRVTVIGRQDEVKNTCTNIDKDDAEPLHNSDLVQKTRVRASKPRYKTNTKDQKERREEIKLQTDHSITHKKEEIIKNENVLNHSTCKLLAIENEVKNNSRKVSALNITVNAGIKPAGNQITSKTSIPDQHDQINGITRVVLCKGKDDNDFKLNDNNFRQQMSLRKPKVSTTVPSTIITKLTKTDIRRKLASLKYPIIVTGKDQVSSCMHVIDYEPPQFSGLNKLIWPFMVDWLPESQKLAIKGQKNTAIGQEKNSIPRSTNNVCDNSKAHSNVLKKTQKDVEVKSKANRNKNSGLDLKPSKSRERPVRLFKDRMMTLVYNKKNSNLPNAQKCKNNNHIPGKHMSIETQTQEKPIIRKEKQFSLLIPTSPLSDISNTKVKSHWAKAKWASDFIENVIRKVKTGVYYGHETHRILKDSETKSTQTDIKENDFNDAKTVNEDDKLIAILNGVALPGFEDNIQNLELTTITKNQITVKHCKTNVTVQFDIAFPFEAKTTVPKKESLHILPIAVNESRIYKYKATITNAALPAEICSIFPKMLSSIFDSNTISTLSEPIVDSDDCNGLSPIKELTQAESSVGLNTLCLLQIAQANTEILQNGNFSASSQSNRNSNQQFHKINLAGCSKLLKLLPKINKDILFDHTKYYFHKSPILNFHVPIAANDIPTRPENFDTKKENTCTAIVPYIPKQYEIKDFMIPRKEIKEPICLKYFLNFCFSYVNCWNLKNFGDKTVVSLNNTNKDISFVIHKLKVDLLYTPSDSSTKPNDNSLFELKHCLKGNIKRPHHRIAIKNVSKKSDGKFCRKCKSTSSISHYKKSTPLQKIANLDEFFQALGSAKCLAGVIDGDIERKILLFIVEMKCWITELTPSQALLILLFANKKESSNLIRFRHVLLQGIAKNRITKASELDMEIEVIEREKLNNSVHFEGISYLPASQENQDNLLEELYWIAKTTASDYQKPFDKTSERLLKSLLSKRKRLNPSYLRVMARYVGLGLLNSK
ncbi:unnamed protein product [Leptosia nina]|uniref:Uncharacterized protein n=1 Tax=Leptosia nina TaxID=320188 RepID=A0AAV1J0P5_9NEOP